MNLQWLFGICLFINAISGLSVAAQSVIDKCGFDELKVYDHHIYSEIRQSQDNYGNLNRSSMTIPVVFHIVLMDDPGRITDNMILKQLEFLNQDFQGHNRDRSKIPERFKELAGSSSIRFCLATEDVEGKPRIGIERVETYTEQIGIRNDLYFTARGGSDAWDTDRYLNVWIADTGRDLAGLGSAPGQRDSYNDGVVIHPDLFNQGNPCRTLTHEIGHYLGLFHMWNADGSCVDQDYVDDTPVQKYPYYDCPMEERFTCHTPDMYMNFMDYTDQDCMYFFTKGQIARMEHILLQYRSLLLRGGTSCFSRNSDKSPFKIYPNPTSDGQVTLKFEQPAPAHLKIQVYSMDGTLLYSQYHWKMHLLSLNLRSLLPGVYVIMINHAVQKLIIL